MLPIEPEPLEKMIARFPLAIAEPVDAIAVRDGKRIAPSSDRKHVFDFEDGMRLAVSIDRVVDKKFLHVSASGTEDYTKSIKDEGFEGLLEDVLLRLSAFLGKPPGDNLQARLTKAGVLHIMFEVADERPN
jgi:hypothetical protein